MAAALRSAAGINIGDQRTLTRAARDLATKQPAFAMAVGHLALERLLQGYGYEITSLDVLEAYQHFLAAAEQIGLKDSAIREAMALADQPGPLAGALLRTIAQGSDR